MNKILFIVIFLGCSFQANAQEKKQDSILFELVKLRHQQEVGFKLQMIQQFKQAENPDITIDSIALANTVYRKIDSVYKEVFTQKEIADLHAFYTSKLGEKLLTNKNTMLGKIATTITKWEMQELGIGMEKPSLIGVDGKPIEEIPVPVENMELPEIANLENLKELVRKDPYIINDLRVLKALLGEEEVEKILNASYSEQMKVE